MSQALWSTELPAERGWPLGKGSELTPVSFLQDEQLRTLVRQFGQQDWKFLASHFPVSVVLCALV